MFGAPGSGNHHFYQSSFVVFPAWLHGYMSTAAMGAAATAGRSNFATLPEAVVLLVHARPAGSFGNRADGPNIGETVTVGGTTYTSVGMVQVGATLGAHVFMFVDGSQF
jgi:hypothetical protein